MEIFEFVCEICGGKITAARAEAGRRTVCPGCNGLVTVPLAGADAATAGPDTHPTPPAPAGAQRQLVCPRCGQTMLLDADTDVAYVRCTNCWTELTLDGTERIAAGPGEGLRSRGAKAAAWAVSVLLHAALLVVFTGVTWFSGLGQGAGGEQNVDVVTEDTGLSTQPSETPKLQQEKAPAKVSEVKEPKDILDVGASQKSETDSIIAIEGGSSESDDAQAFQAFAGGGAASGSASFFGLRATGKKFVFVVDYSTSMEGQKLVEAKKELTKSINKLRSDLRFFIIFYNHASLPMPASRLVPASSGNKRKYLKWVDGVFASGFTDPTGRCSRRSRLSPTPSG